MKRILLFLLFLPIASLGVFAQDYNNVSVFEFEIGAGLNHGNIKDASKGEKRMLPLFFIEPRFNIKNSPLDISWQASVGGSSIKGATKDSHVYDFDVTFLTSVFYFDYNYRKWENVSLFGGIGLGRSLVSIDDDPVDNMALENHECNHFESAFVFSPRVGAEFFNCIRLTAEGKIMRKYSSYYALNIGIVMGGMVKK